MECNVCREVKSNFVSDHKGFKIRKCQSCDLLFVENIPLDLSPYYSEGYFNGQADLDGYVDYESDKEVNKKNFNDHLMQITKFWKKESGSNFLEVGCATGYFLELARDNGWQVSGIDISKYAAEIAQKKGLSVTAGIIEDLDVDSNTEKFAVAILFDVIEHVKDPRKDLQILNNVVKKDGLIVIATPDAGSLWARLWGKRWHALVPPQHLHFFNENNSTRLLLETGFEKIYVAHPGKLFRLPYIIRTLHSWTGWKFWNTLLSIINKCWLKNLALPINLGDTLLIIARKK